MAELKLPDGIFLLVGFFAVVVLVWFGFCCWFLFVCLFCFVLIAFFDSTGQTL
jgi:hypothetical protein